MKMFYNIRWKLSRRNHVKVLFSWRKINTNNTVSIKKVFTVSSAILSLSVCNSNIFCFSHYCVCFSHCGVSNETIYAYLEGHYRPCKLKLLENCNRLLQIICYQNYLDWRQHIHIRTQTNTHKHNQLHTQICISLLEKAKETI